MRDFARRKESHRPSTPHFPHWIVQIGIVVVLLAALCGGILAVSFALLAQHSSWNTTTYHVLALFIPESDGVRTQVVLVGVDTLHQTLSVVVYPDSYEVQAGQAGKYSISALYGLSILNHQSESELRRELMQGTGVLIDAVALAEHPPTHPFVVGDLPTLLLRSHGEGFGLSDRLTLWWYALQHRSGATLIAPGPDATKALMHPEIGTDGSSIAVVNSSGKSHIASLLGKLLSATGMNVIGVTDTASPLDSGKIVVATQAQEGTYTSHVLEELFGVKPIVDPTTAAQYRSMIVIFVGKNQAATLAP